jgi:hypothetical protein
VIRTRAKLYQPKHAPQIRNATQTHETNTHVVHTTHDTDTHIMHNTFYPARSLPYNLLVHTKEGLIHERDAVTGRCGALRTLLPRPVVLLPLRPTKHVRHASKTGACASNDSSRLIDTHVLLHHMASSLALDRTLNLALFVNTYTLNRTEEVKDNRALHSLILSVCAAELRHLPINPIRVRHSR